MKYLLLNIVLNAYDKHSVYSIAAILKQQGHTLEYFEGTPAQCISAANYNNYDIRMYSVLSPMLDAYCAMESKIADKRPSIAGGFGITFTKKKLPFTELCTGDAEPWLTDKSCALADISNQPFPDRDPVYKVNKLLAGFSSKQFLSGRGCPYKCSYCFNHAYKKLFPNTKYVRRKPVDYIIEEIERVNRDYPFKTVVFQDDTFILDRTWIDEWASKWHARMDYTCNVRANLVTDDVCFALKSSGCRGVNWSIESGSERLRNDVLHRNMSDEQIYHCAELLHKWRIPNRVASMIGLPGETAEDRIATLDMTSRLKAQYSFANIFVPMEGLDLTKYAIDIGAYDGRPAPLDFVRYSVLSFSESEHHEIRGMAFLWSALAWFKISYRPLAWIPIKICKMYRSISDNVVMALLYRVNARDILLGIVAIIRQRKESK